MPQTIMQANSFTLNKITKDIFYWENCFENLNVIMEDLDKIKSDKIQVISDTGQLGMNLNQWELEKNNIVRKKVLTQMIKCFYEYSNINNIEVDDYWIGHHSIGFRYISPSKGMGAHTDVMSLGNDVNLIPSFTMIAYLDSDYSGGEIFFEDAEIKPSAGSILIFKNPLHGVREMQSGHRTIVMQPLVSFKTYGNILSELWFAPFKENNF
jgi:hypothetical protein